MSLNQYAVYQLKADAEIRYYPSNKMVLLSSDYFTALLRIPKLSVTVREAVPSRYHEL